MARATCEQSTEYAKDREQFGTPIGAFQAVKHRCADMAVRAEAAECSVRYAALALVDGDDASGFFVHSAAGRRRRRPPSRTRQANVQNHGGIGFTWEHTAHRYVTRSQVRIRTLGGTPPAVERAAGRVGPRLTRRRSDRGCRSPGSAA